MKLWKRDGFTEGSDGAIPIAALTFDAGGNLYGMTLNGGNSKLRNRVAAE
jgi:hypothetical protein